MRMLHGGDLPMQDYLGLFVYTGNFLNESKARDVNYDKQFHQTAHRLEICKTGRRWLFFIYHRG